MKRLIFAGLCALVGSLVAGLSVWRIWGGGAGELPEQSADKGPGARSVAAETPAGGQDVVTLSAEKLAALNLRTADVSRHQMRLYHTVPGRLQYDDRRHAEIRAATAGILAVIRVKPGDRVSAGDILAELNSAEVGQARADVLQRAAELQVVIQRCDWEQRISRGLLALSESVRQRQALAEIRRLFQDVALGTSREKILTAYSQLLLAEELAAAAAENVSSGVVPRKVVQQRQSDRESADAVLQGTLEQLLFEAGQTSRMAEIAVEDAQRRLTISRQSVATLLATAAQTQIQPLAEEWPEPLSLVQIRAPFGGTIERVKFTVSERVSVSDTLFVLADTSTLWVAADLRDRDRAGLSLAAGEQLQVFPGPDAEVISAVVHFAGREVDPATNAIPLTAVVTNELGRLRPGMFVMVRVPMGMPSETLAVPDSAIVEHESRQFVFVPLNDRSFRRTDVIRGRTDGGLTEIVTGLSPGEQVVVSGAFGLKSELLLAGEEE